MACNFYLNKAIKNNLKINNRIGHFVNQENLDKNDVYFKY